MSKIEDLIAAFSMLEGIGKKSAERIAINLLSLNKAKREAFVSNIESTVLNVKKCSKCNGISFNDICEFCIDDKNENYIVIVSSQIDLIRLRESKVFKGYFYVLEEEINPSKGYFGDEIDIAKLNATCTKYDEIVLATNATIQGELTANFIYENLRPLNKKITRLGSGIPIGASINYIDDLTLQTAFKNREVKDE